jgi:tetratricopeptide (TPR) repeat protein
MSAPPGETGTLEAALANAIRLLEREPALAAEQAEEILKVVPDSLSALYLLARARARAGRGDEAIALLRRVVERQPAHPEAWRVLADHLHAVGDAAGADEAYLRHVRASTKNPGLQQAAVAMVRNDIPRAEALLKAHLMRAPTDVPAIRMLAELAMRCGRNEDAEHLFERCLELAPGFAPARYGYAILLHRRNDPARALVEVERLLAAEPKNPAYRNLCAVILGRVGEYARSIGLYRDLLAEYPTNAKIWLSFGHVLKTEGLQDESIEAYRRSIALEPAFGEAYWSLANLKTFRFTAAELEGMKARLADPTLSEADRVNLHFAFGKAYEDAAEYARSFEHYARGNALQRAREQYDPDTNSARMRRLKTVFTREFFASRPVTGCPAPDPVFIVSMPRAGSTLLEQILSSHSSIEGTQELPEMITLARDLRAQADSADPGSYADVLAAMSPKAIRDMGEQYLERTRIYRKTGRPYFIDKMPNNFMHLAMIHLALPNAKIIDARRHPMACCFSNFKQHYARGQRFSYDLTDIGRFYRDYVELMEHFDAVLPGRVHRVYYERLVDDTEGEVRRVLEHCGLPFEAECLRFFENERAVRTASSEQVRQPIYRGGVDQWRHYEPWLEPLKVALGPVVADYPAGSAHRT